MRGLPLFTHELFMSYGFYNRRQLQYPPTKRSPEKLKFTERMGASCPTREKEEGRFFSSSTLMMNSLDPAAR